MIIIWMEYIWGIEYKCKSTTRVWNYNQVNRSVMETILMMMMTLMTMTIIIIGHRFTIF